MRVFVDAGACPVVGIIEKVAKEYNVPVTAMKILSGLIQVFFLSRTR